MEAEQVIEKILSDARTEAEAIAKEADDKIKAEEAKAQSQLTDYRQQTEVIAKKAAEDEKSHILAGARMEAAKEFLAAKTAVVDEVFKQARQKLLDLPDKDYRDLMVRLMVDAVETGEEEIVVGKNEKRIDQKLIDEVNGKLDGQKGKLKLAKDTLDLAGGFILRRGKIKSNVSVDVLLGQARNDLGIDLAKDLFS